MKTVPFQYGKILRLFRHSMELGKVSASLYFEGSSYTCTSLASRNEYLYAGYGSGHIRIFNLNNGSKVAEVTAHSQGINALTMHSSKDLVIQSTFFLIFLSSPQFLMIAAFPCGASTMER